MIAILISAIYAVIPAHAPCLQYDALAYSEVWHTDCQKLNFVQIGGLDWVDSELRWQWWRIINDPCMVPQRLRGEYYVAWYDKRDKCHYRVSAPVLHVWRTVRDPEVDDRSEFAESQRRGLK